MASEKKRVSQQQHEKPTAKCTVFVRNLPYDATNEGLEEVFSEIGPIKSCFVVKDKGVTDKCRGFGFVTYADRVDAEKATTSPHALDGRKLHVKFADKKPPSKFSKKSKFAENAGGDKTSPTKHSFFNEADDDNDDTATPQQKKGQKRQDGERTSPQKLQQNIQGQSANKKFKGKTNQKVTEEEQTLSKNEAKNHKSNKKQEWVKSASAAESNQKAWQKKFPASNTKSARLVIRNLSFKVSEDALKKAFSGHGKITEVKIPKVPGDARKSRGFGFVQFEEISSASAALQKMNGQEIMGRPVAVDWSLPREKFLAASKQQATSAAKQQASSAAKQDKTSKSTKPEDSSSSSSEASSSDEDDSDDEDSEDEQEEEVEEKVIASSKKSIITKSKQSDSDEDDSDDEDSDEDDDSDDEQEEEVEEKVNASSKKAVITKSKQGDSDSDEDDDSDDEQEEEVEEKVIASAKKAVITKSKQGDSDSDNDMDSGNEEESSESESDTDDDDNNDGDIKKEKLAVKQNINSGSIQNDESSSEDGDDDDDENDSDGSKEEEDTGDDDDDDDSSEGDESDSEEEEDKEEEPARPSDVGEGKTLFVRNVPFESTDEDLKEMFGKFGRLEVCRIVMDKDTEHSKGSAFVKYETKEEAEKCMRKANAHTQDALFTLEGRLLGVSMALPRNDIEQMRKALKKQEKSVNKDKRNLYLLREGLVREGTQPAKGVSESDMAKRAKIETIKRNKLQNINVFVSPTRMVVHNLPKSVDDAKLKKMCVEAAADKKAKVIEVRVMRDMSRPNTEGKCQSLGYAFVEFTEHEHALAALRHINNNPTYFGETKRPIVGFSLENKTALEAKQKRLGKSKIKGAEKTDRRDRAQAGPSQAEVAKQTHIASLSKDKIHTAPKTKIRKGLPSHMGPKKRWRDKGKLPPPKKNKSKVSRGARQRNQQQQQRQEQNQQFPKNFKRPAGGQEETAKPRKKRKMNADRREESNFNKLVSQYKNKLFGNAERTNPQKKQPKSKWFNNS